MFDYDREYSGFKSEVESMCTKPAELERVRNEFKLFEERGWQKYIVVLSKIMRAIRNSGYSGTEGGSARDSYALRMYSHSPGYEGLIGNRRGEEILFNDALRMNYKIEEAHMHMNRTQIRTLDRILDPIVRDSGLQVRQKITKDRMTNGVNFKGFQEELIVLSDEPIPDEDFNLILNETEESSECEAERLRKYLIVKLNVDWWEMPF